MKIRIATRSSPLAIAQAEIVASLLKKHHNLETELIKIKTQGDILLDQSLSKIGGKGLFLKEIEKSLISDDADIAVHSMKDVPVQMTKELCIPCILKREDDRDAFLSIKYFNFFDLPQGSTVGTSSSRRKRQINALRPDIEVISIRGNVNTRLKKLESGEVDAIILAACGLIRNGMQDKIKHYFDKNDILPPGGQGVLGVQIKKDNRKLGNLLKPLNDRSTEILINAERKFLEGFGGSCTTPIAINCFLAKDKVILKANYFWEEINMHIYQSGEAHVEDADDLATKIAKQMTSLIDLIR